MDQATRDILTLLFAGISLSIMVSVFVILFIFKYRQRQKEFQKEKDQIKEAAERELLNVQLEISEKLMQDISLEIHDSVGASLTLAKLQFNSLEAPGQETKIKTGTELITRAIAQLRDLSKSLNGNYVLKLGIINAVERELQMIEASGKISCEMHNELSSAHNFSNQQQIILFRCIQEALNNMMKHSGAELVKVRFSSDNDFLHIHVEDNGSGMKSSNSLPGLGMKSMMDRVEMLGGSLNVDSNEKGTHLHFQIPE